MSRDPLNYYPDTPVPTSSYAIISLICGILSWLGIFGLGGILAVVFGHMAKKEIQNSNGKTGGNEIATAGLILGYANIALSIFGILLFILFVVGVISAPLICIPLFNFFETSFLLVI